MVNLTIRLDSATPSERCHNVLRCQILIRIDRFLINSRAIRSPRLPDRQTLPNLVAELHITCCRSPPHRCTQVGAEISMLLRKPISTATLYGVIAQTPGQPLDCFKAENREMPYISYLTLRDQAFLLHDSTTSPSWTTSIRLASTTLDYTLGDRDYRGLDTLFELLKISGRKADLDELRKRDQASEIDRPGTSYENKEYHLVLPRMTMKGYHDFVERVSSGRIYVPDPLLMAHSLRVRAYCIPKSSSTGL
jgi:hypothetical protein